MNEPKIIEVPWRATAGATGWRISTLHPPYRGLIIARVGTGILDQEDAANLLASAPAMRAALIRIARLTQNNMKPATKLARIREEAIAALDATRGEAPQ